LSDYGPGPFTSQNENVGSKQFGAAGSFAAPALRARVVELGAQTEVRAAVSRYATSARAASPTGSYQAIYDRPTSRSTSKQSRTPSRNRRPERSASRSSSTKGSRGSISSKTRIFSADWVLSGLTMSGSGGSVQPARGLRDL